MTELMQASNELFRRPDDECFPNLDALYKHVFDRACNEITTAINLADKAEFTKINDTVGLIMEGSDRPYVLTQYAAEQFCRDLQVPFNYVNGLPQKLALDCLNYGLRSWTRDEESAVLVNFSDPQRLAVRAVTSEKYSRIYDHEIVKYLQNNLGDNWNIAPTWDGKERGLYAGDRDMFIFLIDGGSYVTDGFGDLGIHRGFFIRNSEVRASSLEITTFLHRGICGNHIVWGAENVVQKRIRHIGDAMEKFHEGMRELVAFTASSGKEEEEKIKKAMTIKLGENKEETVDKVRKMFAANIIGKKDLERSYDLADMFDENPRTAWGLVSGLTRYSQEKYPNHQNKRAEIDRVSGRILEKVL